MTPKDLVVFETLKVHQLAVEPKKVKAKYSLTLKDGSVVSNELIYSYNNPYFNTKAAEDINMASLIVVQVAMNYGLFCKTLTFDGLYDETDKRFILDMIENTSKEIVVNKFLFKNEFLKPPFDALHIEKQERYTNAEVVFENTQFANITVPQSITTTLENEYAILSSGGKDSLLTYGIIKEIGVAHPVFVNESGRHWFTAINAHKYFQQYEPNTAKPWCNSDRIFNWMVKQMPFIKENFQNIRSDMYPIRLWTVAVFLFGVLPIARKRRVGHILIGNEFDTTVKYNHNGISHYNGLYDQSKYFDNALTRYYHKKGWNISQYSILRSLSELLILKVLVKRYPELQKHQVSCHAAHEENGRMLPCGKCEKCRRIVGMLTALDEDPKRCGYTNAQIEWSLKALAEHKIKQIGSDAAHLYHLLVEKGAVQKNVHTSRLAKAHPQIMRLRFDNERSKLEDLPKRIRKELVDIVLPYSDGISVQRDKKWHSIALKDLSFDIPYIPLKTKT
ncbi:hypothetical protein [Flagellimonas meishanensis]|uniref:hypothetical protein n=1 Tax=Flagellimonas meishanensis TaxID=2873264 RepID=UPI001CA6CB11|nr:hypothetical protein [[Muricauda] meishanensis]